MLTHGRVFLHSCLTSMLLLSHSLIVRGVQLAHVFQVPLNGTLREDIATGYVSYEYGTVPGTVRPLSP